MNWSFTQICNASLGLVGAGSIGHYDDDSHEARTCRFYFPILLECVLESYPWKCVANSAGLVRCLYLNLGYELALALRQDPALADQMRRDLEQFFLPVVRMADSAGQGVRSFSQGTLTEMFDA